MNQLLSSVRGSARAAVLRSPHGYRRHLEAKGLDRSPTAPHAPWHNAVLKTSAEVQKACDQAREAGLPLHGDAPKNWDALAALDCILARTTSEATVLDAGGTLYSSILPWLFGYGYRDLYAVNLEFERTIKRGPIRYERGDLTATRFDDDMFDAIVCQSVIEHGVDVDAYFREMSRILKPGGVLITSTDYFETSIDTHGAEAYGNAVKIFDAADVKKALRTAEVHGLRLTGDLDLGCQERPVHWRKVGLDFTFVVFTHEKPISSGR
jgi:SAM-dependent methyltransferase